MDGMPDGEGVGVETAVGLTARGHERQPGIAPVIGAKAASDEPLLIKGEEDADVGVIPQCRDDGLGGNVTPPLRAVVAGEKAMECPDLLAAPCLPARHAHGLALAYVAKGLRREPLAGRHAVEGIADLLPTDGEIAALPELTVGEHLTRQPADLGDKAETAAETMGERLEHHPEQRRRRLVGLIVALSIDLRLAEEGPPCAPEDSHHVGRHLAIGTGDDSHEGAVPGRLLDDVEELGAMEETAGRHGG